MSESSICIKKGNSPIGVRLEGIDLRKPLSGAEVLLIEQLLYSHSVLAISDQNLDVPAWRAFCMYLGPLHRNATSPFHVRDYPEIMVLSNKRNPDGSQVGALDAGQDWHTDMSYNAEPGKFTALHALDVPMRDGQPLGDTQFCDMYAAYAALPAEVRERIDGAWALHDFHKYFDEAIRRGSTRPPLTPEQRAKRPPVRHPMVGRHPVTGRKFLYADPGYTVSIEGWSAAESQRMLDDLFEFQLRPEFLYRHRWRRGDVLLWDNWSTIHKATADYGPTEYRHMIRAQINAFEPQGMMSFAALDTSVPA